MTFLSVARPEDLPASPGPWLHPTAVDAGGIVWDLHRGPDGAVLARTEHLYPASRPLAALPHPISLHRL